MLLSRSPGGTLSATRASSRASSRSGATSGTLERLEADGRRQSARAGAARTAAILLISRHLKAVRDGGAHPPKCAAKGDPDDVCSAALYARIGVRPPRTPPTFSFHDTVFKFSIMSVYKLWPNLECVLLKGARGVSAWGRMMFHVARVR